jgi:hypothetical protein
MSHFTTLVSVPGKYSEKKLNKIMQPYHEFECTGNHDEYVDYHPVKPGRGTPEDYTEKDRIAVLLDKDNKMVGTIYSEEAQKVIKRLSISRSDLYPKQGSTRILPEGYCTKEVTPDTLFSTYEEYLKEWLGYTLNGYHDKIIDGVIHTLTNPNKKWDYWRIIEPEWFIFKDGSKKKKFFKKKDLDLEAMSEAYLKEELPSYQAAVEIINGRPFKTWSEIVKEHPDFKRKQLLEVSEKMEEFAVVREVLTSDKIKPSIQLELLRLPEEELIQYLRAEGRRLTFAILHNKEWAEAGAMGWWGLVRDEKKPNQWASEYQKILDEIPDNMTLVVVDCHI